MRASERGWILFSLVSCLLLGCQFPTFPDPNDPRGAGTGQPEVLRRQVKGASDALFARVVGGEITDREYRDLLASYTDDLLKGVKVEDVDPSKAWEYGEVFRTGRLWKKAEAAYRVAVKTAKDEDRRVNDTLSLAEALAQEGRVEEAVETARRTFGTEPEHKAPILYAVLYRIVPGGQGRAGKAGDLLLARLLEDAVRQSNLVRVDERTEAGRTFLVALPHHQHGARELAARLYLAGGKEEDAERVLGGKLPTIRV